MIQLLIGCYFMRITRGFSDQQLEIYLWDSVVWGESSAPWFTGRRHQCRPMVYYVRVLDIYVTLSCVCVCMLSGQGPMGNLYVIVCYTCMFVCWVGPVVRVRARTIYTQWAGPVMCVRVRLVILIGRGPLCELGRDLLHSLGGAYYMFDMCDMLYLGETR